MTQLVVYERAGMDVPCRIAFHPEHVRRLEETVIEFRQQDFSVVRVCTIHGEAFYVADPDRLVMSTLAAQVEEALL